MKILAVLLSLLWLTNSVTSQTACSEEGNTTCVNGNDEKSPNRVCLNYGDGNETCGNCLNEYLEFQEDCYFIPEINFTLVDELITEFAPDLPRADDEQVRVDRLKKLAFVVSFFESRIPPVAFELELNKFSFDTEEEQKQLLGYLYNASASIGFERFNASTSNSTILGRRLQGDPPSQIDWEAEGALTDVKDQGRCGSCWAVATVGAIESAAILTPGSGFDQSLSFQQLISCDDQNSGCDGGNILLSTRYTWKNKDFPDRTGGVATLNDYGYSDYGGTTTEECKLQGINAAVYLEDPRIVMGVNDVLSFQERQDLMKQAVSIQPVPMVLRSGCALFSSYGGGVMTEDGGCACGDTSCIDHAVMMVGYNFDAVPPYWKLRNSWGTGWGEGGYFRIAADDPGAGDWGLFGVLAEAVIPLEAYNTTAAEPDDSSGYNKLPGWAMVLAGLAGVIGLY